MSELDGKASPPPQGDTKHLDKPQACVVLVHGIGSISTGDVLHSAVKAIRIEYPGAEISESEQVKYLPSHEPFIRERAIDVRWQEVRFVVVEFFWSGIEEKIRMSKPIDAVRKLFTLLHIAPTVGVSSTSSEALNGIARFYARGIPLVLSLFVACLIGLVLFAVSGLAASGSRGEIDLVLLLVFSIPLASFCATGLVGFVFASVQRVLRIGAYEAVFAVWLAIAIAIFISFAMGYGAFSLVALIGAVLHSFISEPNWGLFIAVPLVIVIMALTFFLALAIANLLRDVVLYLGTNDAGDTRPQQRALREQFWELLRRLHVRCPEAELIIVGHSLGSVIVVDTLREQVHHSPGVHRPIHLVTAGSPLRRLIRRLLPNRIPPIERLREEMSGDDAHGVVRWVNCYRILDYVGQALLYSALPRALWSAGPARHSPRPPVEDRLIDRPFSFRFGRTNYGHANYWGDERFLGLVAREILAPILRRSVLGNNQ